MSNVRSITPLPPADFTPQLGNYRTLQPFRYWCQKVLPLVYDDSLSYYELLCKVVDYLNKTMEDVETLHGDVTNLHIAYEELQSYVNNYFSSLDVQEEINNKLDEYFSTDEFKAVIDNAVNSILNYPFFVTHNHVTFNELMNLDRDSVYELFDAYVNSGLLTKDIVGYGSANSDTDIAENDTTLPIYRYRYTRKSQATSIKYKKRILVISCVHGNEKSGIHVILTMLKCFTENSNKYITKLMNDYDFDFIPIVNPYGFNLSIGTTMSNVEENIGRTNQRGVNIARNEFSYWEYEAVNEGNFNYKGKQKLSETESRMLSNLYYNHYDDYSLLFDIHNERYSEDKRQLYGRMICGSAHTRTKFINMLNEINGYIKENYNVDIISESNGLSLADGLALEATPIVDYTTRQENIPVMSCLMEGPRYNKGEITPVFSQKIFNIICINALLLCVDTMQEIFPLRQSEQEQTDVDYKIDSVVSPIPQNYTPGNAYQNVTFGTSWVVRTKDSFNYEIGDTIIYGIKSSSDNYQLQLMFYLDDKWKFSLDRIDANTEAEYIATNTANNFYVLIMTKDNKAISMTEIGRTVKPYVKIIKNKG